MAKLKELAKVIRSKNSGPYEITFDIMFPNRENYSQQISFLIMISSISTFGFSLALFVASLEIIDDKAKSEPISDWEDVVRIILLWWVKKAPYLPGKTRFYSHIPNHGN